MKKYKCILLVDDDIDTTVLGRRFIENMNIAEQVHAVSDGKEALEFIISYCGKNPDSKTDCPEVILLDIHMPEMGGFEFLSVMREKHNALLEKMKIFILSISEEEEDMILASDFNVSGYIMKPLTKQKIIESLLKGLF